jgi:hypothetical protein
MDGQTPQIGNDKMQGLESLKPFGDVVNKMLAAAEKGPVYFALFVGGLLAVAPEADELYRSVHLGMVEVLTWATAGVALIVFAGGIRLYEFKLALQAEIDLKRRYYGLEEGRQALAAAGEKDHADKAAGATLVTTKSGS